MRLRKLQILDEDDNTWTDEAYALEDDTGQVEFRYNTLTWGRVGASLNQRLQKENISLEDIQTVIPSANEARWLEIEEINGDWAEIKAMLDETCNIPRPKPVSVVKSTTA